MVQRKVPNKIGTKPHLHILDTQLVNLKPSSTPSSSSSSSSSSLQTHEKLKKIMKKSRSIKRADEPRSLPPFKTKKTPPATPQKQSPNYMKSTSSFEARKEQSPSPKTPITKASKSLKTNESSSNVKRSRTSSLKVVRTLTKTPSFKLSRPSKKMIICEDVDSQRATCSSTLKDSKFPDYLQLNDGGTELDGTSAMKVCPYSYCSLNGRHHHAPVPPLKCFLSARRRALKTQKGFKLGCLSPRQIKPTVKKSAIKEPVNLPPEEVDMQDFFIDICSDHREQSDTEMQDKDAYIRPKPAVQESPVKEPVIVSPEKVDTEDEDSFPKSLADIQGKDAYTMPKLVGPRVCESLVHQVYSDDKESKGGQDLECSDIDWEEGYSYDSDGFKSHEIDGGGAVEDQTEKTSGERLYNEHQELYDEESVTSGAWSEEDGDSASDGSCQNLEINQDYMNYDESEVSSTASESDTTDKMDQDINHQQEQTSQESKTVPDFAEKSKNEGDTNRTTIIYNIIQFNISVFINGEKMEHTVHVPATSVTADKMEAEEVMKEHDKASEVNQTVADEKLPFDVQDLESTEQSNAIETQDNPEQECIECEACTYSTSMDEEPAIRSDVDQTHETNEITSESNDDLTDPCVNLGDLIDRKKPGEETGDDSREYNLRGPNFLTETPDPDAEIVDLRHQDIDERKNAEEWMVDYALQQAVTTLAPARKKKVALLVEAFEKVMPDPVPVRGPVRIPRYEPHNKHTSKAFTNSRPMQACS